MDKIARTLAILTGYADAAFDAARYAFEQAEATTEPIARRLWESEGAKEGAVARAYRTAITEIATAIEESSEQPA
jgi:hypothetical protein